MYVKNSCTATKCIIWEEKEVCKPPRQHKRPKTKGLMISTRLLILNFIWEAGKSAWVAYLRENVKGNFGKENRSSLKNVSVDLPETVRFHFSSLWKINCPIVN